MDEKRWDHAVELLGAVQVAVDAGHYDDALVHARRSVRILARVVGKKHPDYASARLALGRVLQASGDPRRALPHFKSATATFANARARSRTLAALTVDAMLALAHCLQEVGMLDEARVQARAALRLASRHLGANAMLTANAHNLLGVIEKFAGRWREAERHYRAALVPTQRRFGASSLEVATILHNLGGLEHARGNFARGEPPARRSVEIARSLLRADDPERLAHEVAYAALLDGLGRHRESIPIYRHALSAFTKRFGRTHYEVASTLHNLAAAEHALGRVRAAETHYVEASALLVKVRGEDHPDLALTRYNLAILRRDTGRVGAAHKLLVRALATFRRRLGPNHPQARACRAALASMPARGRRVTDGR